MNKFYATVGLSLALSVIIAAASPEDASAWGKRKKNDGTKAGRLARQTSMMVNNDHSNREERLHYYNRKGKKYREERVIIDRDTRRIKRTEVVPRKLWSK